MWHAIILFALFIVNAWSQLAIFDRLVDRRILKDELASRAVSPEEYQQEMKKLRLGFPITVVLIAFPIFAIYLYWLLINFAVIDKPI